MSVATAASFWGCAHATAVDEAQRRRLRYGAGGAVEPALATEWASTVNSDGSETVRFRMAHRGPDRLAAELPRHCLSLSPSLLVIVCKDN